MGGATIRVPPNWPLEVLNGILRAVRRGRIREEDANDYLKILTTLNLIVDASPAAQQWQEARALASAFPLSAYDSAYLALARRLGIGLAMFDERLRVAATLEGVPLIV